MYDSLYILSTVFVTAHWLIVAGLSLRVIARRLPVGVSLAWLTVAFSIPFLGALLYLIFGEKRLGRERIARQALVQRDAEPVFAMLRESPDSGFPVADSTGARLYREALRLLGMPALKGNRMRLLRDYGSVFDAWVKNIDAARESCRLGFYIWCDGGRADDVTAALLRARERGVRCRLLVDAIGSKAFLKGKPVRSLREAGVEVVSVLPPSFQSRADLRYHRKILVIDDRLGYIGSQNLVDPRFFKQESGVGQWVDAVVEIDGPAVALLSDIFELDWCMETGADFEAPGPRSHKPGDPPEGVLVQVVASGPGPYPDAMRQLLLTAIYSARQTLTLTTPYFVPDDAVLTALCSASLSGVEVTLIVPAKHDSFLVRYASAAPFDDLLEAGVRIALFQGGLLHTKSMVIDGTVSLFGSVNIDMRSFWLDFEDSLIVYGPEFAALIADLQGEYLTQSAFLDADTWQNRPAHRRFMENAVRLLGPLL